MRIISIITIIPGIDLRPLITIKPAVIIVGTEHQPDKQVDLVLRHDKARRHRPDSQGDLLRPHDKVQRHPPVSQEGLVRQHVRAHQHQRVSQGGLLRRHVHQVQTILPSGPGHLPWGLPAPEAAEQAIAEVEEVTAEVEGIVVAEPGLAVVSVVAAEAEDDNWKRKWHYRTKVLWTHPL